MISIYHVWGQNELAKYASVNLSIEDIWKICIWVQKIILEILRNICENQLQQKSLFCIYTFSICKIYNSDTIFQKLSQTQIKMCKVLLIVRQTAVARRSQ